MKKTISLNEAQEGMILVKPVTNNGLTLCAEGTKLTTHLIKRFGEMEITAIVVETAEEMTPEEYLALEKNIQQRFARINNDDSLLGKLKKVVLERLETPK